MTRQRYNLHDPVFCGLLAMAEVAVLLSGLLLALLVQVRLLDASHYVLRDGPVLLNSINVFAVIVACSVAGLGARRSATFDLNPRIKTLFVKTVSGLGFVALVLLLQLGQGITYFMDAPLIIGTFVSGLLVLLVYHYLLAELLLGSWGVLNLLIITDGPKVRELIAALVDNDDQEYDIKGIATLPGCAIDIPQFDNFELDANLLALARRLRVRQIVVAVERGSRRCLAQPLLDCKIAGIKLVDADTFHTQLTMQHGLLS